MKNLKNNILLIEEIFVWIITYILMILSFFIFVAFYGDKVRVFFEKGDSPKLISESDISFVQAKYGIHNNIYHYINNILDFINSVIPNNILVLFFLVFSYVVYLITINYIQFRKPSRNSWLVYFSKALGSITSGISSLVFFILISLIIICSLFGVIGLLNGFAVSIIGFYILIYLIFSIFIFIADRFLINYIDSNVR